MRLNERNMSSADEGGGERERQGDREREATVNGIFAVTRNNPNLHKIIHLKAFGFLSDEKRSDFSLLISRATEVLMNLRIREIM